MITIFKTNSMKNASEYVMNVLKQVDKSNLSTMRTVIVPDRASLEAERALLKAVGGSFNIQVRTFRRLANEILPKYNYLSKQAGIMALTGIIQDCKKQLVCYTKGVETAGFVADMYDTISMMKYCKVSPEMLERDDLPRGVSGKAHDIAILYRAYLNYTKDRFIDSADKMDLLCDSIPTSQVVANSYFYLYDFDNFSAQELALVEKLMLFSKGVTVACCASDNFADRHLYLNDIYDGVVRICKNNGIQPTVVCEEKYSNAYTEQIGKHLFRYDKVPPIQATGFVETYQGSTRVQEVYALACRAQKYVRNGGRYKDIYVVTSDISKYTSAISTVFEEFGIPYFCDRQFNLFNHPYARYILDYLNLCRNNGKLNFVLPFVKNYLFCGNFGTEILQDEDVFHFENYCLKYNVSYNYDRFTLGKSDSSCNFQAADDFREKFNTLYKQVQFPQSATAATYIGLIKTLIAEGGINARNDRFAQQQMEKGLAFESKVTAQAEQKFGEVLVLAENILGDRTLKLDDFIKLLTVAVSSVKISVIPVVNDCVVFANMAKARKHDIKFLALLGANFGAMPIVKSDCKLLSDKNMQDLALSNIHLEPQIIVENKRERFSLFQLLQEPTEKLYVSYAASDGVTALTQSQFVAEIKSLFLNGKDNLQDCSVADEEVYTKRQALAKVVLNKRKLKDSQPVNMPAFSILSDKFADEAKLYEFDADGNVTVQQGKLFYLGKAQTSVSKITDFYKCPYKFYFEYGLHVRPREVAELKSSDLGNILHEVLELYVRGMNKDESDETTMQSALDCYEKAISGDYYKGMRNDIRLAGTLQQLKAECIRMCFVVKKQFAFSNFANKATELSFGEGETVPPVEVDYGDGKFLLIGKIDRVDVKDDKFIVIDYKSGAKAAAFSEKDLYVGQKLQLLVYVKAAKDYFHYTPVGFYYFAMHDSFSKGEEDDYVYNGRTLFDLDTACELDSNLKNGASKKLGLTLTPKGNLKKNNRVLTAEQIDCEVDYSLNMIKQAGKLMAQGYANVSPYGNTCDYCDFKDICNYGDVLVYDQREVKDTISKDTIEKIGQKCKNTQDPNKM